MNRHARRAAAVSVKAAPPSPAPGLDPAWRRWLAENLLLGVDHALVIERLVAKGCAPAVARAEIAAAEASPYFQAALPLRNRLAKRDWLLGLAPRHAALAETAVARRAAPSPETFLAEHYAAQRPAVLTGLVDHWPARAWTPDRLAALPGGTPVEVQRGRAADPEYEINVERHRTRMPLAVFLAALAGGPANDLYLTANNGGHNRTALAPLWDEVGDVPGILAPTTEAGRDGFLWIGPAGTVTPWHHDLTNNLLVQLFGRKAVRLVSPAETPRMLNHRHCYSLFGGDGEMAGVAAAERPRVLTVTLEPGDALFIPVGWWHHVVGLSTTIGMSFTNFAWPNESWASYSTYDQV